MARLPLTTVFALAMAVMISCQPPGSNHAATAGDPSRPPAVSRSGPVRDLSQDEAAGGHILRKHVGQSDQQLLDRLNREHNISGASTYTDRGTAERVVGTAIAQSHDRIERWLSRGRRPNLVLDYDSDEPIGRTINRGESQSRPCSHALVVLKYEPPSGYYVLTSYPECR